MRRGRPSLTARSVALARAKLPRPQTPDGDADAERRLYAGLRSGLGRPLEARARARMEGRTRFFDQVTLGAVAAGVPQVVIVGAGYDGRALRFKSPGTRFFEVDHPATQQDKRRRLEALGTSLDHVTFVAVDLVSEPVDRALSSAGYRADQPGLFLCEGLLMYLPEAAVEGLLVRLRALAEVGGRLALSGRERDPSATPGATARLFRLFLAAVGEPRRSAFGIGGTARLLEDSGWKVAREIRRPARDRSERLLIVAEAA